MQLDLSEHVARELAAILHVSTYHIASQETTKKKKKKRRLSIKVNTEWFISVPFFFRERRKGLDWENGKNEGERTKWKTDDRSITEKVKGSVTEGGTEWK